MCEQVFFDNPTLQGVLILKWSDYKIFPAD